MSQTPTVKSMITSPRLSSPAQLFGLAGAILVLGTVSLEAADPPAASLAEQRDFSAEAEAARHSDRSKALRDSELRRRHFDQQESREWQNFGTSSPASATIILAPGGRDALELPPEIRQLQKSLGGSQVDRFPTLRGDGLGAPSPPSRNQGHARSSQQDAISALRAAATQLDATANRLEQLDLYRQADGLRHQAQQLRIDARGFGGDPQTTPTPSTPTPTSWEQWPASPGPAPAPQPTLLPDAIPQPSLDPVPVLAPSPAADPRILSDPPKPQPLNDAPASTPSAEPKLTD